MRVCRWAQASHSMSWQAPHARRNASRSQTLPYFRFGKLTSWMPSKIQAISPLVDRLVRLIEGSQCVPGEEFDVELLSGKRWKMQSSTATSKIQTQKYTSAALPAGKEISIVVMDQGKGFDFARTVVNTTESRFRTRARHPADESVHDDVHFERGGSEVHMRKRARVTSHS